MNEETHSLHTNKTWILVLKPKEQKVVDSKWVFKVMEGTSSSDPIRFKERLVA